MRGISIILLILLTTFSAHATRPMVVYYESWSADPAAADLTQLPAYVTHVILSFAKPNAQYTGNLNLSGSGLNLPYSGQTLKAAVASAKQQHPSLQILLAVGGATYHEWHALNTQALVSLVNDLGLDGIDIDYEQTPPDAAQVNQVTQRLRAALPANKTLTMAVMHVAAYGQDQWQYSQPTGSDWTGFLHQIQPALTEVSMINVMSYDAGASYNAQEAYHAFRYYYSGVISMGMEVPPEAWGDHRWTVAKVEAMASTLDMTNDTDGLMLWSLHKNSEHVSDTDLEWPSANLLASTACSHLMLADAGICAQPLRAAKNSSLTFRNDAWNAQKVYFVVDASPHGYPRTQTIAAGKETTVTGVDIPVTKQLPVYVNALGYETPCIDASTGKALLLAWAPSDVRWKVNFWLDNKNIHLCSAAQQQ